MVEALTGSKRQGRVMWAMLLTPLVVVLGIVVGFRVASARVPSCSWPLTVRGTATPAQVNLARCYVKDLAHRDTGGLTTLMVPGRQTGITPADLVYSKDARHTPATAVFTPNPADTTYLNLTISYPGHVTEHTGMMNVDTQSGTDWRMDIGT